MKTFWVSLTTGEGIEYIQVHLFIVTPPAQWGPIFTIRTAPADRCAAALKRAVKRNGTQKVRGRPPQAARRCVDDAVVRAMIRARLEAAIP
jgi:hypothetical protein